jgi:ubiquinone/menaquinone biosynthesis C-methylase UbiE
MQLKSLSEEQNKAFDAEYHTPRELAAKVEVLRSLMPQGPSTILDIGGGNGKFLDALLQVFPSSEGYLLDVSEHLLSLNKPVLRKHIQKGSCDELDTLFAGRTFDLITLNWLLHHLVGSTYGRSVSNVLQLLEGCRRHLKANGVIIVAENMFDGALISDGPSRLIYALTSMKAPWFTKVARRFFNTAGVGVCFHSQRRWENIFGCARLMVKERFFGDYCSISGTRRLMYSILLIKTRRHGHYVLSPRV